MDASNGSSERFYQVQNTSKAAVQIYCAGISKPATLQVQEHTHLGLGLRILFDSLHGHNVVLQI